MGRYAQYFDHDDLSANQAMYLRLLSPLSPIYFIPDLANKGVVDGGMHRIQRHGQVLARHDAGGLHHVQ